MTYTDISSTDLNFNNFTSFADYNSFMSFTVGIENDIDLNDNEYIRVKAYSLNKNK